jgi:hypothetical protein
MWCRRHFQRKYIAWATIALVSILSLAGIMISFFVYDSLTTISVTTAIAGLVVAMISTPPLYNCYLAFRARNRPTTKQDDYFTAITIGETCTLLPKNMRHNAPINGNMVTLANVHIQKLCDSMEFNRKFNLNHLEYRECFVPTDLVKMKYELKLNDLHNSGWTEDGAHIGCEELIQIIAPTEMHDKPLNLVLEVCILF